MLSLHKSFVSEKETLKRDPTMYVFKNALTGVTLNELCAFGILNIRKVSRCMRMEPGRGGCCQNNRTFLIDAIIHHIFITSSKYFPNDQEISRLPLRQE